MKPNSAGSFQTTAGRRRRRVGYIVPGILLWALHGGLQAGEPPIMDVAEDTTIAIDRSGKTLDFTAAGGECTAPDAARKGRDHKKVDADDWQEDGGIFYVWIYNDGPEGLSGRPAPDTFPAAGMGDNRDRLRMNRDEGGGTAITVYAVQHWKTEDGRTAVTRSPAR